MNRWLDYFLGVPLVWIVALFSSPRRKPGPRSGTEVKGLDPGFRRDDEVDSSKKILIIKLAAAGDTILLGPALRSFRMAHPNAEIHWLVSPINFVLARRNKSVDRIVVWSNGFKGVPSLVSALRRQKYDVVIDLEQWSRGTVLLSYLSGARCRLGFDTPGQHRATLLTKSVVKRYERHEIHDFYAVLELLGPLEHSETFDMTASDEGRGELALYLKAPLKKTLRVLLHPGCGADGAPREWPLGQYGVLAHWLMKKYQAELFLTAGPEERRKTQQLNKLLNGAAHDFGGKLSWEGLIALIDQMDLVISGNTGVMHLAAALGKKQVALHGPTNPLLWGPLNSNARIVQTSCEQCPCLKLGFEYHKHDDSCMKKIDIEQVKNSVGGLIDKGGAI